MSGFILMNRIFGSKNIPFVSPDTWPVSDMIEEDDDERCGGIYEAAFTAMQLKYLVVYFQITFCIRCIL